MIRSYARALDLDPEPLVIRLPAEAPSVDSLAEFVKSKPIPITDTSRGVNLLYGAFSLIIAGVIAAGRVGVAGRAIGERADDIRAPDRAGGAAA
jgi:cytoskeletal protein RodZ